VGLISTRGLDVADLNRRRICTRGSEVRADHVGTSVLARTQSEGREGENSLGPGYFHYRTTTLSTISHLYPLQHVDPGVPA
jgi:hypothetical protein